MGSYLSNTYDDNEIESNQESYPYSMDSIEPQSYIEAKKFRNLPVTILTEILKEKIKLDEKLVKENNAILKDFLDTFIPVMKECDKLFKLVYKKIYYTGSYYSDLRVSTPDEFDLNLVLDFPLKNNSVEYHAQVPSYAKYSTTDQDSISTNGLTKLFKDRYLIPNEVRVWLQSVVDKALTKYNSYPKNVVKIKTSGAGPARTIILVKKDGCIDIDLVPAIECSMKSKPPGIKSIVYEKVKTNLQCFLIPKPYQPTKQAPVNEAERARLWRTHYPEAEAALIHNVGCVKPVIKLLKLLRDKEGWKILASYYLKTIVMWMVLQNSSPDYWKLNNLSDRFMEALNILAEDVQNKRICYFFSSRYNLLEKLADEQAKNIHNRLCSIIRNIQRDEQNLWNIFKCHRIFSC